MLQNAIGRIANQLFDGSIQNGLSLKQFMKEVDDYISTELGKIILPIHISVSVDKSGNDHDYNDIVTLLLGQKKVFYMVNAVAGERHSY